MQVSRFSGENTTLLQRWKTDTQTGYPHVNFLCYHFDKEEGIKRVLIHRLEQMVGSV